MAGTCPTLDPIPGSVPGCKTELSCFPHGSAYTAKSPRGCPWQILLPRSVSGPCSDAGSSALTLLTAFLPVLSGSPNKLLFHGEARSRAHCLGGGRHPRCGPTLWAPRAESPWRVECGIISVAPCKELLNGIDKIICFSGSLHFHGGA